MIKAPLSARSRPACCTRAHSYGDGIWLAAADGRLLAKCCGWRRVWRIGGLGGVQRVGLLGVVYAFLGKLNGVTGSSEYAKWVLAV